MLSCGMEARVGVNDTRQMLQDIEAEVHYTRRLLGKEALREDVLRAMESVPRDKFVPSTMRALAYHDGPLAIGHGQTISQPFIVAVMTDLLDPHPEDVVLEVGTGSGYQAAILASLVKKVFSLEIIPELAEQARLCLQRQDIRNVEVIRGNGYFGLPQHAPYDGIIVTAAATHVSPYLVEQLKPGGHLVIPLGQPFMSQELTVIEKQQDGSIRSQHVMGVVFVPLTHENERAEDPGE